MGRSNFSTLVMLGQKKANAWPDLRGKKSVYIFMLIIICIIWGLEVGEVKIIFVFRIRASCVFSM